MMLANPWLILGASFAVAGAIGGSYVKGRSDGKAVVIAKQAREDQIRLETLQLAQLATAEEIAKIQVVNRTIYAKATHEIVEKPVYRDCRHDAGALGLLNDALTNTEPARPTNDRGVSGANTARW
jgi:hypothetical protein